MSEYQIVLYYMYHPIDDVESFWSDQQLLCKRLWLTGRILVAPEGVNGTLEWSPEAIQRYCETVAAIPWFEQTDFKLSAGTGTAFSKLSVKIRDQLVALNDGDPELWPVGGTTGKYLSADELYQWFVDGKEFYIIDMRNDYETEVGQFINSICPKNFRNFRNLPDVLPEMEHLRDKTVVTVCTGGIRCEKASGFLLKHGFRDVYQLHNGIVTFMEKFPNEYFKGKLYVFDQRYTMGFNTDAPEHEVIGRCRRCGKPTEHYANWYENGERRHGLMCPECCASGEVQMQKAWVNPAACGCFA